MPGWHSQEPEQQPLNPTDRQADSLQEQASANAGVGVRSPPPTPMKARSARRSTSSWLLVASAEVDGAFDVGNASSFVP